MRFMILRKADPRTEAGILPSEELMSAMGQYMEAMAKAGILLGGDGLAASSKGARVRFTGGKTIVMDGPFAETKELLAGYVLIKVASLAEALSWVERWPELDRSEGMELEVRRMFDPEDFGPSEAVDHHVQIHKSLSDC